MDGLNLYANEFLTVFILTLIVIVIPGPDFLIVVKNSLTRSRISGIYTALGIATAVWVHIIYSLMGLALIISRNPNIYNIIKYLGVCYLIYLGIQCLFMKKNIEGDADTHVAVSHFDSFKMGFVNNALNPKATIFFLSLFTQVVNFSTPISLKILYGLTVSLTCLIWFSLVAYLLNHRVVKDCFFYAQNLIIKFLGFGLLLYALKTVFEDIVK